MSFAEPGYRLPWRHSKAPLTILMDMTAILAIRHFHISHNTPCLPPPPPPPEQNNWQKHFFQFFLGRLYYPEINAKFGAQKRCIMGDAQMANKINQWTYCSLSLVSFFRLLNLPFLRKEINPAILTSRSSNVAQHILRCNLDARGFLVHQSGIKERNENTEKPLAPRQSRA